MLKYLGVKCHDVYNLNYSRKKKIKQNVVKCQQLLNLGEWVYGSCYTTPSIFLYL